MTTSTATYQVTCLGDAISSHRSEAQAVRAAKKLGEHSSVVLVVTSGTYRSKTQVWPEARPTYSN